MESVGRNRYTPNKSTNTEGVQRHHLLFPDGQWSSHPTTKEMREMHRNTVLLDEDTHRELHKAVPFVPILSSHVGFRALHILQHTDPSNDNVKNIESIQRAIEYGFDTPRAHRIEREVGELAIHALELQKPFIADGAPLRWPEYFREHR